MNLGTMRTELLARGYDDLSTSRANQLLNDATVELDELYLWPYREVSATGTQPLTVSGLSIIEQVTNETDDYVIEPRTFQWLSEQYGDLTTSGDPEWFYVAWPSGAPVVATYPSNGDTIGVQYWKTSTTLSADADTPLAPSRYHSLYVLIAQRMAENLRGNLNIAAGLQAEIDRQVGRMVDMLIGGQHVAGPADQSRIWSAQDS